jgi:hypothetical protein
MTHQHGLEPEPATRDYTLSDVPRIAPDMDITSSERLERLLDTATLAARSGVSARTVEGWRRYGTGPNYTHLGRRVVYRVSDVARWEWEQSRDGIAQRLAQESNR